MLQCLGQGVAVVGVARHGPHAHHQAFLQRGGDADLHAKLVRCSGLAFADAFHLTRVQGIQLVLVLGSLSQDATGALQQILDLGLGRFGQFMQLSSDFTMDPADPGAQLAQGFAHAFELLGVRVAPDLRGQPRSDAVVVLAQSQPVVFGRFDQVLAALVQQPAVAGVGNGLGHDSGVHDHLLRAGFLDDTAAAGGLDAGRQQRLHAFFSNALSPARQAGRVDGQFGLQVGLATEELPVRVLHPGVDDRLVGGIEGVLQVQQPGDEAWRQG